MESRYLLCMLIWEYSYTETLRCCGIWFFHVAPPPILLYKPQIVVVKARVECETALTRSGIRRVGGELEEMAGGLGNCASLVIIRCEPSISLQAIIIDLHPTYM